MAVDNRIMIENKVKELGYEMGCYHSSIDRLSKKELAKVMCEISGDSTDVDVKIRGKLHVVEISVVDDEIDFTILTQNEYIDRYGDERWEDAE